MKKRKQTGPILISQFKAGQHHFQSKTYDCTPIPLTTDDYKPSMRYRHFVARKWKEQENFKVRKTVDMEGTLLYDLCHRLIHTLVDLLQNRHQKLIHYKKQMPVYVRMQDLELIQPIRYVPIIKLGRKPRHRNQQSRVKSAGPGLLHESMAKQATPVRMLQSIAV